MPLLHVDIKHGLNNQITRMSIFEGDNIRSVVRAFSLINHISMEVQAKLIDYVES